MATCSVIFLGIGSIPSYAYQTVAFAVGRIPFRSDSLNVVAPTLSDEWTTLLDHDVGQCHVPSSAEPFLDDLLRALTMRIVERLRIQAADVTVDGIEIAEAVSGLLGVLEKHPARLVWL